LLYLEMAPQQQFFHSSRVLIRRIIICKMP
jgi:hypothetical protein